MILQVDARERIERRERLVHQQHFGAHHQRTRDGDALRLPAGEFARPDLGLVGKADALELARDALGALRLRQVREAEADIAGDREPRQQARLLEDRCRSSRAATRWCRRRARRCPGSDCRGPTTRRSSVDLPQPEPPTTATISPGATSSDTPSSARTRFAIGLADVRRCSSVTARPLGAEAVFPAQERRGRQGRAASRWSCR